MESNLQIIEGTFALVSSGNCTNAWLVDGDDIQERANAAMDTYWGSEAKVFERGVSGYALDCGGKYLINVYRTREQAERAIKRIRG